MMAIRLMEMGVILTVILKPTGHEQVRISEKEHIF